MIDYCCSDRNGTGARACALASVGGSADTGLRAGVAIGGGGVADVLRRRFCSEALAIARAICSWLALSCSAVLAFSRTSSSWLVLSCSIPCCTFARSRAIVWSNSVSSGGIGAAAASCGTAEPEVAIAKVHRPPQPPERQAGSAGRRASVFPPATAKPQPVAVPTGRSSAWPSRHRTAKRKQRYRCPLSTAGRRSRVAPACHAMADDTRSRTSSAGHRAPAWKSVH